MTKYNFLNELERKLARLSADDRQEIMEDYENHFTFAKEAGKSDEEVIASLGTPAQLAKEVLADYQLELIVDQAENDQSVGNVFRAIFAVGALGFFNLVFILTPAIFIYTVIFALSVTSIALTFTPILFIFATALGFQSFYLFELFASIASSGIGILMAIGMVFVTKFTVNMTIKYLKLNLKMIKGGRS